MKKKTCIRIVSTFNIHFLMMIYLKFPQALKVLQKFSKFFTAKLSIKSKICILKFEFLIKIFGIYDLVFHLKNTYEYSSRFFSKI